MLTPVRERMSEFYIQKFYIHKMKSIYVNKEMREHACTYAVLISAVQVSRS